jgi:hypothetical protein
MINSRVEALLQMLFELMLLSLRLLDLHIERVQSFLCGGALSPFFRFRVSLPLSQAQVVRHAASNVTQSRTYFEGKVRRRVPDWAESGRGH